MSNDVTVGSRWMEHGGLFKDGAPRVYVVVSANVDREAGPDCWEMRGEDFADTKYMHGHARERGDWTAVSG